MEIIAELSKRVADLTDVVSPIVDGATVNFKNIEMRESAINSLLEIKAELSRVGENIEKSVLEMKKAQTADVEAVNKILSKFKKDDWTVVSKSGRLIQEDQKIPVGKKSEEFRKLEQKEQNIVNSVEKSNLDGFQQVKSGRNSAPSYASVVTGNVNPYSLLSGRKETELAPEHSKIYVTESLYIEAIKVQSFADVKQDGNIYYVEPNEHFAYIISRKLFHGNIGNIFVDETNPTKIKSCKFHNSCTRGSSCQYFHDPMVYTGSKDSRNFIANSWLYAPINSKYKLKYKGRKIGSRNNLEIDIGAVGEEDILRFYDQITHDTLCALVIHGMSK